MDEIAKDEPRVRHQLINKDGQFHRRVVTEEPSDSWLMSWFRSEAVPPAIDEACITSAADVRYLQPLLYFLARTHHAKVAVEIGVADGSTTFPLVKAVSECGGMLYSIDPSVCVPAREMVRRCGFERWWAFRQTTSDEFFAGSGNDDGTQTTLAGTYGTQRALREVLPSYDVDVMPLTFGICGVDRYYEWTETGAILIRKRRPGEFQLGPAA
jgi:hypothetical protein